MDDTLLEMQREIERLQREINRLKTDIEVGKWINYTPTVTAAVGAYTTVSASGRYMISEGGKLCHVKIVVTITTNGTAAGGTIVTLPTSDSGVSVFSGRENAVTGIMLQGITQGSGNVGIVDYNNAYAGGDGRMLILSGMYEIA